MRKIVYDSNNIRCVVHNNHTGTFLLELQRKKYWLGGWVPCHELIRVTETDRDDLPSNPTVYPAFMQPRIEVWAKGTLDLRQRVLELFKEYYGLRMRIQKKINSL